MNNGIILIVDDNNAQRLSLHQMLLYRGFEVESAGDVSTARSLIEQHRNNLGLLILDMRLEDPEFPDITGADLGIELKKARLDRPPEFLINSAYSDPGYYRLSLALGAAAYLHKKETDPKQLICHARALLLRRALKDADVMKQTQRISSESKDVTEIVARFCQEILAEKLKGTLGMPFVFLLTADDQTQCCVGSGLLPEGFDPTYEKVQAYAFGEVRAMKPVKLDTKQVPRDGLSKEDLILDKLNGASFLPFSLPNGIRLSVGLLWQDPEKFPLADSTENMASVLAQYFKNEVLEPLLDMIIRWRLEEARAEARREEVLRSTSKLCFYVGQELLATLQQDSYLNDPRSQRSFFDRLKTKAVRLRDDGKILMALNEKAMKQTTLPEPVAMAEFVREGISDLDMPFSSETITIEGNCFVHVAREDLLIITSRLLRWFVERLDDEGAIHVCCAESDSGAELIFEDCSSRLPLPLRERLFFLFSEPDTQDSLYLVKMLIEMKYHGTLSDQTEKLPGEFGHRFIIHFPPPVSGQR